MMGNVELIFVAVMVVSALLGISAGMCAVLLRNEKETLT